MFNKFTVLLEKAYAPVFNLTITVAAARIYGAEAVGNLALVFVFSALGQFLTSRGTDQNIYVVYASSPISQLASAAIAEMKNRLSRLLTSILGLATLYVFWKGFMPDAVGIPYVLLGTLIGSASACAIPNEIRLFVARDFRSVAALKYASGFIAILFSSLSIFYFASGVMILIEVLILEKIVYLVLTMISSRAALPLVRCEAEVKTVPGVNIHVLVSAAAIFGYNRFDQVYVYDAFSSQELGVYFSTLKLFEVANLFIMAALNAQLHVMADQRRCSSIAASIERRLLGLSCCLVGGIAIAAPLILQFVFGMKPESFGYVYILAAGTLFGLIGAIKGPWVAKKNRFNVNTYFTIAGSAITIGALILCKPGSLVLVALTMALGQFVVNVLCPLMLKDEREYLMSLVAWCKK